MNESWNLNVHLRHGKRPGLVADDHQHLDVFTSLERPHDCRCVTIYTWDAAQRAWAEAMSRASAEFWARHDADIKDGAALHAAHEKAEADAQDLAAVASEEAEANGQFGVGA